MEILYKYHKTRVGELILGSSGDMLCMLDWRYRRSRTTIDNRIKSGLNAEFVEGDDEIIHATTEQLEEYLSGDWK